MKALVQEYLKERSGLLRVAYRILGSQSEAEDLLQELYLKISRYDGEPIEQPKAWLMRVLVNSAIDQKRTYYRSKLDYVGSWLPEPWVENEKPLREVHDDVSMAFMVLMERLNPIERAVFVLRETCELSYGDIAEILSMSEAACRKSWQRAEGHLDQGRKRFSADPMIHQNMTQAFMQFWAQGRMDELIKLLQSDATLYSDGGGKVTAAAAPIAGANRIGRFLASLLRAAGSDPKVRLDFLPPDQTCLIVNEQLETVICLETDGQTIFNLYFLRNPDKLARIRRRLFG